MYYRYYCSVCCVVCIFYFHCFLLDCCNPIHGKEERSLVCPAIYCTYLGQVGGRYMNYVWVEEST